MPRVGLGIQPSIHPYSNGINNPPLNNRSSPYSLSRVNGMRCIGGTALVAISRVGRRLQYCRLLTVRRVTDSLDRQTSLGTT
eukprot:scaffold109205_cov54-Attheya_sp.AAC.4